MKYGWVIWGYIDESRIALPFMPSIDAMVAAVVQDLVTIAVIYA